MFYTKINIVGVLKNASSNQMNIVSTETGKLFLAKSPKLFTYDSDGNLTNDGRWAYSWNAVNRLIAKDTSSSVTSVLSVVNQKLQFASDYQSRRISKIVRNWTKNG